MLSDILRVLRLFSFTREHTQRAPVSPPKRNISAGSPAPMIFNCSDDVRKMHRKQQTASTTKGCLPRNFSISADR